MGTMEKWVRDGIAEIARELFRREEGGNHGGFPLGVSMEVKRKRPDIWEHIYEATKGLDPHQTISSYLPRDVTGQLTGKAGLHGFDVSNETTERRKATIALISAILQVLTPQQQQEVRDCFQQCVREDIVSEELLTDPLHDEIEFILAQFFRAADSIALKMGAVLPTPSAE